MGSSIEGGISSPTDRVERIRLECCAALDMLRDCAALTRPHDPFKDQILQALTEVARALDAIQVARQHANNAPASETDVSVGREGP